MVVKNRLTEMSLSLVQLVVNRGLKIGENLDVMNPQFAQSVHPDIH
jgi:hypothetical protein